MKKNALYYLIGATLIILVVAVACQPDPTPPPDAPVSQPTKPPVVKTDEVQSPEESSSGAVEATEVPVDESGVATDIPVHEGVYKLQAMRKGSSITYQVDTTIDELVAWYQSELPNSGWEMAGPPDSAIGAMATMLRENGDGDRLTVNMQANEIAGFVSVTIQVTRGGQ